MKKTLMRYSVSRGRQSPGNAGEEAAPPASSPRRGTRVVGSSRQRASAGRRAAPTAPLSGAREEGPLPASPGLAPPPAGTWRSGAARSGAARRGAADNGSLRSTPAACRGRQEAAGRAPCEDRAEPAQGSCGSGGPPWARLGGQRSPSACPVSTGGVKQTVRLTKTWGDRVRCRRERVLEITKQIRFPTLSPVVVWES